jgi:hypothetical protein
MSDSTEFLLAFVDSESNLGNAFLRFKSRGSLLAHEELKPLEEGCESISKFMPETKKSVCAKEISTTIFTNWIPMRAAETK